MKPNLVIGLGNPLLGDEGIGYHVAVRLAADSRLPADADVLCGGTDLLRYADQMEGRRRVILVDAMLDASEPGTVSVVEDGFLELDNRQEHVHHLSVVQTIHLLQVALPSLRAVRFTLIGISIRSADVNPEPSPALSLRMPDLVLRVLQELNEDFPASDNLPDGAPPQ